MAPWLSPLPVVVGVPALAHVGDLINGIDVVAADPADAEPRAIEASFGLVVPDDDGGWAWVCHEAVTTPQAVRSPRYALGPDGTWLAWLPDPTQGRDGATLFRSDDGCQWDAVPMDGVVAAAAWSGTGRALAVTEAPGGVFASDDGGRTFSEVLPPDPAVDLSSVAVSAGVAWVAGLDVDGRRVRTWVDADNDGPEGFVEREVPIPPLLDAPLSHARLLAVSGPTAVVGLSPTGGDAVVRTDDFGATWTTVYEAVGFVIDAEVDGDATWLVVDGTQLVRVDAGGAVTSSPGFPRSLGIAAGPDTVWAAPQSSLTRALLSRSDDGGATFETAAYPDDIAAPLACPAGTEVAEVCAPLWDTLLPRIRGFDEPPRDTGDSTPTTPTTPDPEPAAVPSTDGAGCGCGPGGPAGLGGVAVLLTAISTVRRRR